MMSPRYVCSPVYARGQAVAEYAFAYSMILAVCLMVLCLAWGSLVQFGAGYSVEFQAATGDMATFFGSAAAPAASIDPVTTDGPVVEMEQNDSVVSELEEPAIKNVETAGGPGK